MPVRSAPKYKKIGKTSDGVTVLAPLPKISTPSARGRQLAALMAEARKTTKQAMPKMSAAKASPKGRSRKK